MINLFQESYTSTKSSQELKNNLKTWTSIVTTNFNSAKTSVLRGKLETLLQNLLTIIKCGSNYTEDLFIEILQLEISIIQAHHVMVFCHSIRSRLWSTFTHQVF